MVGFSITGADGLSRFGDDLGKVASRALPDVDKVLEKGALNIKNDLVAGVSGSTHFKGMAGSIDYEAIHGAGGLSYEVGPNKAKRGGALGNIYYFGTSRGGGHGDLEGPLLREAPSLESHLDKALGRMVAGL